MTTEFICNVMCIITHCTNITCETIINITVITFYAALITFPSFTLNCWNLILISFPQGLFIFKMLAYNEIREYWLKPTEISWKGVLTRVIHRVNDWTLLRNWEKNQVLFLPWLCALGNPWDSEMLWYLPSVWKWITSVSPNCTIVRKMEVKGVDNTVIIHQDYHAYKQNRILPSLNTNKA